MKEDFLEVLSDYQGIIHKVNLIYFRNSADREDNLQEIIYQLWKSFPGLHNRSSIGSWIYSVSINTSISKLRKSKKIQYTGVLPELKEMIDSFEEKELDESIGNLMNAIYELNEIDKSIMLLYLEEKSYREISVIMGISESCVGVRITRAKDKLKHYLNQLDHGR